MVLTAAKRDEFVQWAKAQGVRIGSHIKIRDSELGGTGVFLDVDAFTKEFGGIKPENSLEVLRIPQSLKLSLDSIAKNLLASQVKYDHNNATGEYIKQGTVFTTFLSQFQIAFEDNNDPLVRTGLSETNILVGEIQILSVLKSIRDKLLASDKTDGNYKKFLNDSPFKKFDPYLELLQNTEVPLFKLDKYFEEFTELFKYNQRDHKRKIEALKNSIVLKALDTIDENLGFDPKELVDLNILRQVEASVISRILEIPEELTESKDEDLEVQQHGRFDKYTNTDDDLRKVMRREVTPNEKENEEEEEFQQQGRYDRFNNPNETDFRRAYKNEDKGIKKEYSFSVASTLVPVIDFVNHSNDLVNASFDVDRLNKDVLLKIDGAKFQNLQGEVELFITYSEVEDVYKFAHSYGFIPKSSMTSVLFEHPIDRDYLLNYVVKGDKYDHNLGVTLKWFGIQPNIQFVFKYGDDGKIEDVSLNLDDNYFPFSFTKNLKYVPEHAFNIFKKYGDSEGQELPKEYIEELVKLQESNKNDIVESFGLTPYISPNVDEEEDLLNVEYLVENTSDDQVNVLIAEFVDFLVDYLKLRLVKLDDFLKDHNDKSSIVVQLASNEKELIEKFISKTSKYETVDEKVEHLILGADDLNEEWLKNRMLPISIPVDDKLALHQKFTLQELKNLTFSRGEENDVSYDEKK